MLSGVGPAEHLATHDIPLVSDLPGVGSSLRDHAVVYVRFGVKNVEGLNFLREPGLPNALRKIGALAKWSIFGSGPLTSNVRMLSK